MMIDSVVWTQYVNTADTQTHTQTDSHVATAIHTYVRIA